MRRMPEATAAVQHSAPALAPVQRKQGQLSTQYRAATVMPATYNEADNTVEVVWTTGARRRAYDWWNDTVYEEELVVSSDAIDMARFEAGVVQVLDGHNVYGGVRAILGIATRGWLQDGEGRATLRLSERPELAGIVQDIRAGVIRSISFGYDVTTYEITPANMRTDGVNLPLYRATRWAPQEISFVTVPADPNAQTRGAGGTPGQAREQRTGQPCEFITRAAAQLHEGNDMPQANPAGAAPAAPDNTTTEPNVQSRAADDQAAQRAAEAAAQAAVAASARAAEITDLCVRSNTPALAAALIREGVTLDVARTRVQAELAQRDLAAGGHINVRGIETVQDERETVIQGIEEMLLTRVDSRAKLTDNGRRFRGMTLLELGRDMLEGAGVRTRGMDKLALATRILTYRSGMHTTGDFSSILANVAGKRLRAGYEENPGTYTRWARRAPNAPDFKTITVTQLSAMPDLLKTNEAGEFKYGALTDGAETYALLTYGRIVNMSRQALINDDLRAFDRMVSGFGGASARLENRLVYSQITSNPTMADTVALFHATHNNLGTGAPSALEASSMTTGRTAMRLQKGLQSEELNLAPAFLIVPAALEQTAYQLTSSNYMPATQATVNEFRSGGRTAVEPIVEPILDANSAKAWYFAASNGQVDTVEYCYLDGAEGPVIESEVGFEVDGMSLKCRLDFAAKVLDWRGLYKANGA